MKKTMMQYVWLAITMMVGVLFNLNTLGAWTETSAVSYNGYATVPSQIAIKGRQAVTHYLLKQVKWVTIHFEGKSLATPESQATRQIYLPKVDGFTGIGSFAEISDIVAANNVDLELIEVNGQYDLRVDMTLVDENWKQCLVGSTWFDVQVTKEPVKGGDDLLVAYGEPWVTIPGMIYIDFGTQISGAKWLVGDLKNVVGQELDLVYDFSNEGGPTAVSFPSHLLGGGYLAVVDTKTGNTAVFDLRSGTVADSETAMAVLGQLRSSDVMVLQCPEGYSCEPDLNLGLSFNRYDGRVWGRYPLVEYVTSTPVKTWVRVTVPIWGTKETVPPVAVTIIQLETEKLIELKVAPDGTFPLELEPGRYHIKVDFGDQITDWNLGGGKG